ncbi:MAG: alpha/beta fold hydrolase [Psychrobium sp.]
MSHWLGNLQQSTLQGTNNIEIHYCAMVQEGVSPAMIMVNGRTESYLKYQSLINEFYQLGYSVYMLDHRGQGLSQRLLDNHHKGHVEDFSYYVEDLAKYIDDVVLPKKHTHHILLGHSMGGTIATRYVQTKVHQIERLILASPMHGILLPAPQFVVEQIANAALMADKLLQRESSYVLGGKPYDNAAFEENELTQDEARYSNFRQIYDDNPQLQLGSPTYHWLQTSLVACKACIADAPKITIPTLLLQAGAETIVDNEAQNEFVANMNPELIEKMAVEGARHELFFELEDYRTPVIAKVRQFLSFNDDA